MILNYGKYTITGTTDEIREFIMKETPMKVGSSLEPIENLVDIDYKKEITKYEIAIHELKEKCIIEFGEDSICFSDGSDDFVLIHIKDTEKFNILKEVFRKN